MNDQADKSLAILLAHEDDEVRKHAENVLVKHAQLSAFFVSATKGLQNLKTNMEDLKLAQSALIFDLTATRRERDEALKG
jgi:hypothetical protein